MNSSLYEPPKKPAVETACELSQSRKKIYASVMLAISSTMHLSLYHAIPKFADTFESFGTELPTFTQFIVDLSHFFLMMFVACLLMMSFWVIDKFSTKLAIILLITSKYFFLFTLLIFATSVVAMYLPVFNSDSAV